MVAGRAAPPLSLATGAVGIGRSLVLGPTGALYLRVRSPERDVQIATIWMLEGFLSALRDSQ